MWWWISVAAAHEPGLSRLRVDPDSLSWYVAAAEEVEPGWLGLVSVRRGAAPCVLGTPTSTPTEGDGVEIRAALACPDGPDPLEVSAGVFGHLAPGHRALVEAAGAPVSWLDADHPRATLPPDATPRPAGSVVWHYLGLGVEHILTGWDHLLFLFGLLLGVRTAREAVGVVTAFTVAHSVTLALATLRIVTIPASVVEPAIALTVAWVGVENLLGSGPPWRRIALTGVLGLVHGLGFAGLLAELGVPASDRITALLSFNGGVELGQLALVAVFLPFLTRVRESPRLAGALRYGSVGIVAVGLGWFVERIGASW